MRLERRLLQRLGHLAHAASFCCFAVSSFSSSTVCSSKLAWPREDRAAPRQAVLGPTQLQQAEAIEAMETGPLAQLQQAEATEHTDTAALAAERATMLFENLLAPPQQAVKRKWEDCDYKSILPEFSNEQPRTLEDISPCTSSTYNFEEQVVETDMEDIENILSALESQGSTA